MKIIEHKFCRICKVGKPEIKNGFRKNKYFWIRIYKCRKCNLETCKKFREKKSGRLSMNKAVYRSIEKYKFKQEARMVVKKNIRLGLIIRPKICSQCEQENKYIEAHHDDYTKPLKIIWLCKICHMSIHKNLL